MRNWFEWIRLGGAIYLTWLGISRLRNAGRVAAYGVNPTGELFRDGFLVAIANPEVILFLAAFLPPFVDPAKPAASQLLALSLIFIAAGGGIGAVLAGLAGQARHILSGERLRYIDQASGGLLIIAGLWLAWPSLLRLAG